MIIEYFNELVWLNYSLGVTLSVMYYSLSEGLLGIVMLIIIIKIVFKMLR